MYNYSMTICSFYIHKKNSLKGIDILDLRRSNEISVITENKQTEVINIKVIDILYEFLNEYTAALRNESSKKTFCVTTEENYIQEFDDYTRINFIVNSGYFGIDSVLRNVYTNEIIHSRSKKEADEKKFNITLVIPKSNNNQEINKGLFIFQNYGIFGVKQITVSNLDQFINHKYNLKLTCNNVAPELYIRKVISQENIVEMIMIKNEKSLDEADNIDFGYGKEVRKLAKLSFKEAKWSSIVDKMRYYAKGKSNLFEFENISYDKFKLVVNFNGRLRTIDLHNIDNLSIIEGIPNEVLTFEGDLDLGKYSLFLNDIIKEYLREMVYKKG